MATVEDLRSLIENAMDSRGETNDGIARAAGVAPETVRSIRLGRTSKMKEHSRQKLLAYLTGLHPVAPGQQVESATPRHISSAATGYVRFGGAGTGITGPVFESEAERRGYLRRVIEDAQRAMRDAQTALDAPISAPGGAAPLEDALAVAAAAAAPAATPRPARTRTK
jgi:hypothetical protein